MKRFFIPIAALFSLVAPALTRAAPPIYPGVVPYEQLDTRNFYLGNYPILRIMPFMPKDTPPYLPVDTWSFAVNTNLWTLYAYDPPNTTWHQVLGLGGIAVTINPTDTVMPYRVDATTFGDSPWSVPGAGQAYADGANAFLHLDLATGNSSYHTTTPNSTLAIYPQMLMEQVPAMGDTVSTTTMAEGMLVSNPTPSTAAAPENSPSMYWGGSAWSTNGAASTPMAFAAVGVPRNAANIPTAYWSLFSSVSNRPPTLEFTVKEGSGYTGLGTSYLSDAGTYTSNLTTWSTYLMYSTITNLITYNLSIVQGGVTNTVGSMNPTDGYVPYRLNSTNFADSPWFRMATNKMGFAGYTNVWLEWCPDGVGLDYAVLGMGDGVFGLIDPNSTQFAAGSVGVGTRAFGAAMDARSSVAIGYEAGNYATNVQGSVLIGYAVGGPDNIIDTTIVGSSAGPGSLSVTNSTYVGSSAGAQMRGSFNTTIGAFAGYTGGVNDNTNQISIGASSAVTNSNDIVIGNANNARLIVPITSWTGTGSKVLTDNGTYQTASSVITGAISSQLLWTNSPTGGGSLTASSNVIASLPTGLYGSVFNNSEDIFAAGENAGQGQAVLQSTNLYNIGLLSGYGMTGNEAWMVMNIGDAAGRSATIYNSQDVYNFGIAPGELSQITNGSWVVMNIGDNAGYAMVTDKSEDIFNYGWLSGDSMGVSNSIAIFNYGDWAGRNNISVIQNSQEIYNYGYAAGVDQNPRNSTNLYNYGNIAGGVQQAIEVNGYYNYGTDSGWMGVGLASNSEELYNYGAWAGASLAALVADGTFVNFTNVYNYGPEAGMQIKGTNATYVLNYGYRAGEKSTMTGVSDLYNYGSDSGFQSTYDTSASDIYNYGTSAGKGASYTNSFFILNSGNSAGQSMVAQDSSSILNLGSYAGANMVATNSTDLVNIGSYAGNLSALTNSTHVYTWGYQAGRLLAGDGYTNIYLLGDNAQPTRKTNEFVFGSTNDLYTFPGRASIGSISIPQTFEPGSIFSYPLLFNGAYDDVLYFAHNLTIGTGNTPIDAAEPIWKMALERKATYLDGSELAEWEIDWSYTNALAKRPIWIWVSKKSPHNDNVSLAADEVDFYDADRANKLISITPTQIIVTNSTLLRTQVGTITNDYRSSVAWSSSGPITTAFPASLNIANGFYPNAGNGASAISIGYNDWGTGSSALSYARGLSIAGATWTKGTSAAITDAQSLYITAPTIGANNYAAYLSGALKVIGAYSDLDGLRIGGTDHANTLYEIGGDLSINCDAGNILIGTYSGNVGIASRNATPTSRLDVRGSFAESIATGTSITLGETNDVYLCNVDAQLVTLPTAVGCRGRNYTVKLIAPATTGTVTNAAGILIDGATSYSLTASNKFVHVISDNANWWIIGNN